MLGLATLFLTLLLFIVIPSIWILLVYFIGHKWKTINKSTLNKFTWGLKSFWFISSGYLIASFTCQLVKPEIVNSWINWTEYTVKMEDTNLGLSMLIFILLSSLFSFALLNRKNV